MYERFTDRARKVMQLANQEAQRSNHEYVGTEHVLLAIIKEGSGGAAKVLKNLDLDLNKVRGEVEKIVQWPVGARMGKMPQTPRAKKVIEYSIEEARILNHNYVGTEHLLLGLVREEEGVAGQVLMNLGVKLEDVREEVLNMLGQAPSPNPDSKQRCGKIDIAQQEENKIGWKQRVAEQLQEVRGQRTRLEDLEKRLRHLEGRLSTTRFVLGALTGILSGALLGDHVGAIVGLIAGGLLGALGRFIPASLAGGAVGALLGATYLTDVGGGFTGALLGAILAACIVEVGRPPGRTRFF